MKSQDHVSSSNNDEMESAIEQILQQLSLDEKCTLLSGKNMWETASVDRLGIASLKLTDGPAGVRGAKWTDGSHTTYIPCGISLGATFDPALIEKVGTILGQEARAKQAHVLLAPTMNVSRSPFGGRNFETFGEDPLHIGIMATAYIRGVQSQGVGACMKHFAANDMETRRFNIDQTIDERTLREVYLRPFELALEVQPWTAMTAYPKINGKHADMNERLVKDLLREEWGYEGLVMSDWGGLNSTVESVKATTDLEMPGPPIRYGQALLDAVKAGKVFEKEHVDSSVRRLLKLVSKAGLLSPSSQPSSAETTEVSDVGTHKINQLEQQMDTPEFRQTARDVASSGIVLLKNSTDILPLKSTKISKLAIIGPNAKKTTHGGTGSAMVNPYYITNPLASISELAKAQNPDIEIRFEQGINTYLQPPLMGDVLTVPNTESTGWQVDFYSGYEFQGEILKTTNWQDSAIFLMSDGDRPACIKDGDAFSYRATGTLRPKTTGLYQFSLSNTGRTKLFLDDQVLIDNSNWTQMGNNFMNCGSKEVFADLHLTAGQDYAIRIDNAVVPPPIPPHDNTLFHKVSGVRVGLILKPDEQAMYDSAIEAARAADVVIVVVGHNNDTEREGSDRTSMLLPGRTNDLVSDICAANSNTIVVNQTACAVAMPWSNDAPAILQAWYQGQENGNAIASVLFGDTNPSGKLPLTFPKRIEDHGSSKWSPDVTTDKVTYGEQVLVGYKWLDKHGIEPLWSFGFGLSYTSFSIRDVGIVGKISVGSKTTAVIKATVFNTGPRDGSEVVQVYVTPSQALRDRGLVHAARALVGFQKVHVRSGASEMIDIELDATAVRWFDEDANTQDHPRGSWRVDPGVYKCFVGTSSRDFVAEVEVAVA